MNVLNKNIKSIKIFPMKFSFIASEKNLCILYGQAKVASVGPRPAPDISK